MNWLLLCRSLHSTKTILDSEMTNVWCQAVIVSQYMQDPAPSEPDIETEALRGFALLATLAGSHWTHGSDNNQWSGLLFSSCLSPSQKVNHWQTTNNWFLPKCLILSSLAVTVRSMLGGFQDSWSSWCEASLHSWAAGAHFSSKYLGNDWWVWGEKFSLWQALRAHYHTL